jgi:hypothetical protein
VDLDEQLESFMKKQAEIESGAAFARTGDPAAVIGANVVSDDMAQRYARDIFDALKLLKRTRDMSFNEARLIIAIEDPRMKERRAMGVEDERGVSRDEMAVALLDVSEGRIPRDRIALRCVWDEVQQWPFLKADEAGEAAAASVASSTAASTPSSSSGSGSSDYAALSGMTGAPAGPAHAAHSC